MKVQTLKSLRDEMVSVAKGEIPAPPDAHLTSWSMEPRLGPKPLSPEELEKQAQEIVDQITKALNNPKTPLTDLAAQLSISEPAPLWWMIN